MSTTNKGTVNTDPLAVEHWRERLAGLVPKRMTLTSLANRLAEEDNYFQGLTGYSRLNNIVNSRGGLRPTSRLVVLLERLDLDDGSEDEQPPAPPALKRQKIKLLE